jgi:glycosyltransferase involved in cell wall biosynthesis
MAADVLLVSLKAGGAFSRTIPGKVQSYMASGKPVLGMLDGDGKDLILKTGCGLSCGSGEVDELARLVGEYIDMPKSNRERMGGKGLKFYNSNFKQEIVINHFFLDYKNQMENREKS